MYKIILLTLFVLVCLSACQNDFSCTEYWFNRARLNEEVETVPRSKLKVYYYDRMVNLGNRFKPRSVRFQPRVFYSANPKELYTLVMIDPDAGEYSQLRHWLVINIEGNDLTTGDFISDYLGAGPPKEGKTFHRYAFLLYRQEKRITDQIPKASSRSLNGRANFNVNDFAKKYNLGKPIYGNYFEAKYDSYVDEFYENLEDDDDDNA